MNSTAQAGRTPAWRTGLLFTGLLLILLAVLLLSPQVFGGGTEQVRIRHALLLGADWSEAEDWVPPPHPAGFRTDHGVPADPRFIEVVRALQLDALDDDWARARTIARHLLTGAHTLTGGAIQADLWNTYQRIVRDGEGYCGDFVRVFEAMSGTAGLVVRPWAFTFDGFGGHGHIWIELWNRQRQRWQLIDIFDNFYFVPTGSEEPMSARGLRHALLAVAAGGERQVELRRLVPEARPGYEIEAKAWAYFMRGIDQWYLPFGNNVFSVDGAPVVRLFSGWSRIGEGLGAIASGRSPSVRVLATPTNAGQRQALQALLTQVWVALVSGALGTLMLLALWLMPRGRRAQSAAHQRAPDEEASGWPRICLVGPLPPPSGGMANQCEQLLRLLRADGAPVSLVRTNAAYRPAFIGRVPLVRAAFRLVPYVWAVWRALGRCDVVHVFANSGWAWYLFAQPALTIGRLRGVPVIVNYRGGVAEEFLGHAPRWVLRSLSRAALRVTPSAFLRRVFAQHGLQAQIVPNIIDTDRFRAQTRGTAAAGPHLIVTRNLEPIYDLPTALQAFARIRALHPTARLTIAGSGPQRSELESLALRLGLGEAVTFSGRIDNQRIPQLYASADLMLNSSTVDNMPISILEALASGVPVVTTSAGGITDFVTDGVTALIVPVGDHEAMAAAALRVLADPLLADGLRAAGQREVRRYAWPQVRQQWQMAYQSVLVRPAHQSVLP